MTTRPSFTLSVDANLLYQRLVAVPVGAEIEYKELSALVSRDVQGSARGALGTARKLAQRDNQIVFGVIQGKGLKRLDDVEIVGTGDGVLVGIRRRAKRGARTLACVADYTALPQQEKIRHNATLGVLAVLDVTASEKNVKRIAGDIAAKGLPSTADVMQRTLAAFRGDK